MTSATNEVNYLNASDLIKGDVLLSYGDGTISDVIRLIDGGDYSHAAFYDGEKIVEARLKGVVSTPVEDEVGVQKYVDVYRFKSDTGEGFLSKDWPPDPVIEKAHYYLNKGTKYAHNQLYLVGVLIIVRKLPTNPVIRTALRLIIDEVFDLFKSIAEGKEAKSVVCSELVYRCYYEANSVPPNKYGLAIKGTLGSDDSSKDGFIEEENLLDLYDEKTIEKAKKIEEYFWQINPNFNQENNLLLEGGSPFVAPEMVTPKDLQTSSNLVKIGRLVKVK